MLFPIEHEFLLSVPCISVSCENVCPSASEMFLFLKKCMYVCACLSGALSFTDLAHFWHARPLGQQEGHRLCKVAVQGRFEAKFEVKCCICDIGHR